MKITQAVPAMFAALAALTMKTILTSNWRPVCRALCTLLLGIATLWAMPRSARAQLYVSQVGNGGNTGSVGEYDATTGAVINANLITGLNNPNALALSGNDLFVASGVPGGTVGEYNATTGAAINPNFITTGVNTPAGRAVSTRRHVPGSASLDNTLFVANSAPGTVGEYNAATGAAINPSLITGLSKPQWIALSGNTLFVSNFGNSTVGKYNATTGAAINPSLITGISSPEGFAVSGNNLFVANYGQFGQSNGTVGEYNAATGAAINPNFITGLSEPFGLAVSGTTSSWRTTATTRLANTTPPREP